jgi:signal transduction histidine kinase
VDLQELLERLARRIGSGAGVALGLAMATAIALDLRQASHTGSGPQWRFDVAVGIVMGAIALLRGLNRTAATVAGLAVFGAASIAVAVWHLAPLLLLGSTLVALSVLGASAARSLPTRRAVLICGGGMIVVAGSGVIHESYSWSGRANLTLTCATIWSGALAVGAWLRYRDHHRRETVEAIRREERLELARELHDVVAHHVTGMVVQAQAARFVGGERPETWDAALADIESAGLDTLTAIRKLLGLLRDPADTTDGAGRHAAPEPIGQLVERFAKHGPAVELRAPAVLSSVAWPPEVASTVYRVVQESLTNVARHAPDARSVAVTITDDFGQVTVEVTDDAPQPVAARPSRFSGGYGLVGMRERVEALGGEVRTGPRPQSAGWAVRASLPLPARGAS